MAGSIQMMALKLVVLQLTIAGWLYIFLMFQYRRWLNPDGYIINPDSSCLYCWPEPQCFAVTPNFWMANGCSLNCYTLGIHDIVSVYGCWLYIWWLYYSYLWTCPYVMLLMQANPVRGQVGGSWALRNGFEPLGECHWGPKNVKISRAQPPPICPSNGLPASKALCT
jgi:hypothetical protein